MKAKDYYEKYGPRIIDEWEINPQSTLIIKELIIELLEEADSLNKARHGASKGAIQAIVREQNEKWNAIIRLFERDGHISPLKWNGFMAYAKETMADIFDKEPTPEEILKLQQQEQARKYMLAEIKKMEESRNAEKLAEIKKMEERDLKNAKFV